MPEIDIPKLFELIAPYLFNFGKAIVVLIIGLFIIKKVIKTVKSILLKKDFDASLVPFLLSLLGMILKVEKSFWTDAKGQGGGLFSKIKLPKGALIEIRFPFAWNFRDERNEYSHCGPEILIKNCSFFGIIHEKVLHANVFKLRDIVRNRLYHSAEDFQLRLKDGK